MSWFVVICLPFLSSLCLCRFSLYSILSLILSLLTMSTILKSKGENGPPRLEPGMSKMINLVESPPWWLGETIMIGIIFFRKHSKYQNNKIRPRKNYVWRHYARLIYVQMWWNRIFLPKLKSEDQARNFFTVNNCFNLDINPMNMVWVRWLKRFFFWKSENHCEKNN